MPSTKRTFNIYSIMEECLHRHLPFAGFRFPHEKPVNLIMQADTRGLTLLKKNEKISNKSGFIVFPFANSKMPRVLIEDDFHITDENISDEAVVRVLTKTNFSENGFQRPAPHEASKKEFIDSAEKIISEIKKGKLKKAVLSRVRLHEMKKSMSVISLFKKLVRAHPAVFVYVINLPNIGLWIGATPELLVHQHDNELKTISLAGTRKREAESLAWGKKELAEQKIVTDHIIEILKKHFKSKPEISGPETVQAGLMEHLQTTIKVKGELRNLDDLLRELHPTPAVVGMPKDAALKWIGKTELHDRAYYTGFLGTVNIKNVTRLFVNLRCLEVVENWLALYTGAGITIDSDPEAEWEETQLKTQTLLKAL